MANLEELRTQPQDILAEQSVLGAIFLDESKLVFVREYIEPADFFKYANRLIFQAMIDLNDRGDVIDATTMRAILEAQGDLENIGGFSYLVEVVNAVPTSSNAEYYAQIVADMAMRRRFILRLTESINQAYEGALGTDELIAGAEKTLIDLNENNKRSGFRVIKDILNINFENLEIRSQQTSDVTGIPTGYPELDRMTTGLHEEELI
ncbi:replicative DNA helicase, partial [Streptococcus danieliae]|nr:replicative DNA helicase [Streptococcus danieliae]